MRIILFDIPNDGCKLRLYPMGDHVVLQLISPSGLALLPDEWEQVKAKVDEEFAKLTERTT